MLRLLLMLMLLVATATVASAQGPLVVIAATTADGGYAAGGLIEDTGAIGLAAGETLTLMAEDGTVIRLQGPREGAAASPASDDALPPGLSRIAGFVAGASGETNVLGASRRADGREGIAPQPDIWMINVDSSGERCVQAAPLVLWRKDALRPASVTVRGEREKLPQKTWPTGKATMELPARLAHDGDRLVLSIDGDPRRYTLHVRPQTIAADDWGGILRWMIDKDCKRQAGLVITGLHSGRLQ
ncbi:hypothetical protein GGD81_004006 [Rhodobium orientis]|uniref:Uncharacterized protein n=1 Tax=Rhodobium orientis TaxID=34017 RepID=A0A327JLE1_9HYPH|nr:hypothetical protein [Rhodobium orientis]MBB4304941.1 hypothetical protein [Rhodobium orientis]MBK5951260.1 hypothetical protein [Rhodobium orientis]RAI27097.1 hypothetical protein CH339_11530 [Rhodobium orientis]